MLINLKLHFFTQTKHRNMDKTIFFMLWVIFGNIELIQNVHGQASCSSSPTTFLTSADDYCEPCWIGYEGKCYNLSTNTKRWQNAFLDCVKKNSSLIVINSKEEQSFLKNLTNSLGSWIGLRSKAGTWQWVDGSVYNASSVFWENGYPKISAGQTDKCVRISASGEWSEDTCGILHYFVCEKGANVHTVNNICPKNAESHNTNGSFYCTCKPGFKTKSGIISFTSPQEICEDNNECDNSSWCPVNTECYNTIGSYYCKCKSGFLPQGGERNFTDLSEICKDVNECVTSNSCPYNAQCHNTDGSFYCTCNSGFVSQSREVNFTNPGVPCEDYDECNASNVCPLNAECHNTIGSFFCVCKSGFKTQTGVTNFTSPQAGCNGQPCRCCPESQSPGDQQCSTVNLVLKETSQGIINRLSKARLNTTTSKDEKRQQQKEVTKLLMDVEKSVLNDILSSLNSNGKQEHTIIHHTNNTVIVAQFVPFDSSKPDENVSLTAESTTMTIRKSTMTEGTEGGVPPVAVLISFPGYDIESVLSGGSVGNKDTGNVKYEMNSKVIAATISSKNKKNLNHPVTFTFHKIKTEEDKLQTSTCVFWKTDDTNRSYWSTEGCFLSNEGSNRTHVTCECNHLSSFAVLLAHIDIDEKPLTIISYIGLTFSVICLTISVATFWFCKSIQNASTTLLLNLCICLLIADILFLFGITQTRYETLCRVIAAFLHYFLLACFSWMHLGALQLHLMVQNLKAVKALRTHIIRSKYMYPVGYGVPAIIVAISAAVFPHGYGRKNVCWLSLKRGFHWSFVGPVCFVILMNVILFAITIHMLREKFMSLNKDISTIKNTKMLLFKAIAQFLVLGCTWIFGIFQFQEATLVMSYLFTLLNSFHGVFIFLLYCAANKLVMDEYKTLLRRIFRIKKKDKERETSTTTTTTAMAATTSPKRAVTTTTSITATCPSPKHTKEARVSEWIKDTPSTSEKDDDSKL
ncbi:adhesion G protein-coupled receptor E2-like [Protopterus annectens]|uniref:adhesion G protein-coupled receptor E2-like n=1 Tax=Protopterus annectens TaxID=7888 RepID=UPI001CF9DC98|nr:adhesion G protein-coupled receptor E2-like [Protopterus annectens]